MKEDFALSIVILMFFSSTLSAQNYKVAYRLSYPDETVSLAQEDFYLYVDSVHSEFVSILKMKKDSVMKYDKSGMGSQKAAHDAIAQTKFNFFLIKRYETNTVLFAQDFMKYIAYQQISPVYDWKIDDSTKLIKGFACQKATLQLRGNTYEAWFTDEIPVFDGPYFFQGLPGLILEVTCIERNYKFEFLGIENGVSPIDSRKRKLFAISNDREKFLLLYDDWEKNMFRNIFKMGNMSLADPTSDSEAFINQMQAETDSKRPTFKLEIF